MREGAIDEHSLCRQYIGAIDTCNSVVLSWILSSVKRNISWTIFFSKLGYVVRQELKETFWGSVTFNLHKKINSLTQNGLAVSEYLS